MSVNPALTIFGHASWKIYGQWNAANPRTTYWQPILAKIVVMISHPPPTIERPRSVNSFCGGSISDPAMKCIALFPN